MSLGFTTQTSTPTKGYPIVLTHVVMFTLNDRDEADEILARLRDLRGQIPSLLSLRCGQNAVDKPNSWDIALITEHADEDGLKQYATHPVHLELVEWLASRLARRAVVDSVDFE
ncbi:MAG TPA: stress responsive protein [Actinobacteria bacterium]|jgi:hypothetical protein|nr:stress responsive protein [Actinomycetota bacterium]